MKRVLALSLALILSLGMGIVSFAAEDTGLGLGGGELLDYDADYITPKQVYEVLIEIVDTNNSAAEDYLKDAILDYSGKPNPPLDTTVSAFKAAKENAETAAKALEKLLKAYDAAAKKIASPGELPTYGDVMAEPDATGVDIVQMAGYEAYFTSGNFNRGNIDNARLAAQAQVSSLNTDIKSVESSNYDTVLDAVNAAKAYDKGYLKASLKVTKGSEYIKSHGFYKTGSGQLYLELITSELYLGKTPTIAFELKITFSKPTKIWEGLEYKKDNMDKARLDNYELAKKYFDPDSADRVATNDYILNTYEYRFGWGDIWEVDSDYAYRSDNEFDTDTEDAAYLHAKKGDGEVYAFDFGDTAYVEVKLADQPEMNMYYSEGAIKALTTQFQDADFLFYDWRGKPDFDFTASIELYVDEDAVGEDPYLYYYDGASLIPVDAKYEDSTFYFRSKKLGAYVVASKSINLQAPAATTTDGAITTAATSIPPSGTTAPTPGINPGTGVEDFLAVAGAFAVVSIVAAAGIFSKKKYKL